MNIEAYFKVSYGLYIISSGNKGKKSGYIANTAFQVTAEPARFAISCSKDNFTEDIIRQSGVFSISILDKHVSSTLIGLFGYNSTRQQDKFRQTVHFISEKTGVPVVTEECIAWFECEVEQEIRLDTHTIFIGRVLDNDLIDASKDPLTYAYYHEVKKGKAPKNAPTYIAEKPAEQTTTQKAKTERPVKETRYRCLVCGYVYDPELGDSENGIPPGTPFEDLPDDWCCPVCSAEKADFELDE